jgi:uncharacterized membrane protein YuzA (DUF378 family)
MRLIDFTTLALVICAAIYLSAHGLWNVDFISAFAGQKANLVYTAVGIAGVWQLLRQRWT